MVSTPFTVAQEAVLLASSNLVGNQRLQKTMKGSEATEACAFRHLSGPFAFGQTLTTVCLFHRLLPWKMESTPRVETGPYRAMHMRTRVWHEVVCVCGSRERNANTPALLTSEA